MGKPSAWAITAVFVIIATIAIVYYMSLPTTWDKAVAKCINGGDGDMFTDRQLCERRYDRSTGKRTPPSETIKTRT